MKKYFATLLVILSAFLTLYTITFAYADTISYTYDDAGRLIKLEYGTGKAIEYTYDNAGNLLQGKVTAPQPSSDMDLSAGWHMISLPVDATDKRPNTLFPGAVVMYSYKKGTGYVRIGNDEDLEVGRGYWILLDEKKIYTLTGSPISSYTHTVYEDGWVMIGGCSQPAQVLPQGCHIGVIYGYVQGIGYQRVTDHLERGKGYWILLNNVTDEATISVETVN